MTKGPVVVVSRLRRCPPCVNLDCNLCRDPLCTCPHRRSKEASR